MSKSVDKAYRIIRSRILEGVLAPGMRLKEEELAETIGVSRTPVREALRRLNAEQFVRVSPNHGAHVTVWSDDDIGEIFALRALLEGHAVHKAAALITDTELLDLRAQQIEIELGAAELPPDLNRISRANTEFHRILLTAARSERLAVMVSWLVEMPIVLKTFINYSASDLQRSLAQHRELIDALAARDGDWARSVMQSHVGAARNVYVKALLQSDDVAPIAPKAISLPLGEIRYRKAPNRTKETVAKA